MNTKKQKHCAGCRNNFYNGNNPHGVKECWSLKDAKVVTRYRIGWWTEPRSASCFTKVRTLDCHKSPGNYAHFTELPSHLHGQEKKVSVVT